MGNSFNEAVSLFARENIMKVILFDLGQTLENKGKLLPGALETLSAIQMLRDSKDESPVLALISDFLAANNPAEINQLQQQYYDLIQNLGIKSFFEPVAKRVTLSTEIGVRKSDEKIFRTAVDKISKDFPFTDVIFITENKEHISAARLLGINAIHIKAPDQISGEAEYLTDLVKFIRKLMVV